MNPRENAEITNPPQLLFSFMVIVSLYVVEIAEPVFYGFLREQGDCTFHFTAQLKHIKVILKKYRYLAKIYSWQKTFELLKI